MAEITKCKSAKVESRGADQKCTYGPSHATTFLEADLHYNPSVYFLSKIRQPSSSIEYSFRPRDQRTMADLYRSA